MKYTIKPTPQFRRDYQRARKAGLDMQPLHRVISALAAGEELPEENRDRPLAGDMTGYRECVVKPGWVLVYHIREEALVLTLIRTGARAELYRKGGSAQMINGMKSLYRSPVKTAVTLLLLAAAAFLFLYNLGEYSVSDREYREARDKYEGVLTVEEVPVSRPSAYNDFFLITDPTNPGQTFDVVSYSGYHHESLKEDTIQALSSLPHISRVERRYMTAGVSPDYMRLDTDQKLFFYAGRCIVAATIEDIFLNESQEKQGLPIKNGAYSHYEEVAIGGFQCIQLEDVELLAGDPAWLQEGESTPVISQWFIRDELRDEFVMTGWVDYPDRRNAYSIDNHLCWSDLSDLEVGRRYVFVLRNERDNETSFSQERRGNYNTFVMADDTLIGWWPYFTDITDLPDNWLEADEYADLRELIQVTNDDLHTLDVVYGDDMASIRRVADGRMVCEAGRFITPADAGKPVCVVSKDFLELNGLRIGDNITLNLGNYLCEQYAPLGAVASTRGRYATAFKEQAFTIVGTWRDLNEGNHVDRELYWCWSNNAIFVPSAFLPDCVNAETYTPKPAEISFVVGNPEEIIPFEQETLSALDDLGKPYLWSDLGWSLIGEQLVATRDLARIKLMIFTGAAIMAMVLTVWLFIGWRKQEFAIYRALGMPKREASLQLYVPFLMLGGMSAVAGAIAARVFSLRQIAEAQAEAMKEIAMHTPAGPALYILGTLGFLLVLAAFAWCGILLIRRRSVLELLSGDGARRKERVREAYGLSVPLADGPSSGASRQLPPGEARGAHR
ncbi:MAG: type II toxin-antitoxin system mRNA interferase toxin, RelE/StbE family, partial [Oscillospiraceae bacterium]|nr:type II toxin-antitoxin system mRNA interferase toxin, RelE/StbE family [Oscillospiraceae bacterium]